eukprot:g12164.t1
MPQLIRFSVAGAVLLAASTTVVDGRHSIWRPIEFNSRQRVNGKSRFWQEIRPDGSASLAKLDSTSGTEAPADADERRADADRKEEVGTLPVLEEELVGAQEADMAAKVGDAPQKMEEGSGALASPRRRLSGSDRRRRRYKSPGATQVQVGDTPAEQAAEKTSTAEPRTDQDKVQPQAALSEEERRALLVEQMHEQGIRLIPVQSEAEGDAAADKEEAVETGELRLQDDDEGAAADIKENSAGVAAEVTAKEGSPLRLVRETTPDSKMEKKPPVAKARRRLRSKTSAGTGKVEEPPSEQDLAAPAAEKTMSVAEVEVETAAKHVDAKEGEADEEVDKVGPRQRKRFRLSQKYPPSELFIKRQKPESPALAAFKKATVAAPPSTEVAEGEDVRQEQKRKAELQVQFGRATSQGDVHAPGDVAGPGDGYVVVRREKIPLGWLTTYGRREPAASQVITMRIP